MTGFSGFGSPNPGLIGSTRRTPRGGRGTPTARRGDHGLTEESDRAMVGLELERKQERLDAGAITAFTRTYSSAVDAL